MSDHKHRTVWQSTDRVIQPTCCRSLHRRPKTSPRSIRPGLAFALAAALLTYFLLTGSGSAQTAPTNAEQPDLKDTIREKTREIQGIVIDLAGFPVRRAYVYSADQDFNEDVQTDAEGRFKIRVDSSKTKVLLALSKRSRRMAVIPITVEMPADRRYRLDARESTVHTRVVDSQNRLVESAEFSLHYSGPGGLSFTKQQCGRTDGEGSGSTWHLPAAPGWSVRALLATGESTNALPLTQQWDVDLPDLVRREAAGEGTKTAARIVDYSGRVVDEKGQPIAGALVTLYIESNSGSRKYRRIATNANGSWSLRLREDIRSARIQIEHPDYLRETARAPRTILNLHTLRDGSAIDVLKHGMRVSGRVLDTVGRPIRNAPVLVGESYYSDGDPVSDQVETDDMARTDHAGYFSIGGLAQGEQIFLVAADGYAPSRAVIELGKQPKPLEVVLNQGHTASGRVVDEAGKPVQGIEVSVTGWYPPKSYPQRLSHLVTSDRDGRFQIPNLPRQGTISGHVNSKRDHLKTIFRFAAAVNDIGDVPMYSPVILSGRVLDVARGTSITRFSATEGFIDEDGKFQSTYDSQEFNDEKADYRWKIRSRTVTFGQERPFALRISADGYVPVLTPAVLPGQLSTPATIKLKTASIFRSRVQTSQGKPPPSAQLYLVGPDDLTGLPCSGPNVWTYETPVAARKDGSFEISMKDETQRLIVFSESGYAVLPVALLRSHQPITLTPWARIEGTCRSQGRARKGVKVVAEPIRPRAARSSQDPLRFFPTATTDETGKFVIEDVPAMPLRVGTQVWPGWETMNFLTIKPGQTHHVTLGDDGPAVTGRVDFTPVVATHSPKSGLKFDTRRSAARAIRLAPRPEVPPGVDAADWERQLEMVRNGKAPDDLTLPVHSTRIQPNGSFAFESLPSGQYTLLVDVHGESPIELNELGLTVARGRIDFTVAEKNVHLQDIKLIPLTPPAVGSPAPEWSGRGFASKAPTLSSLRGKYVVLDFWAGWCRDCRASRPALLELHTKYGDKVSFVGLNFDEPKARAANSVAAYKAPWPQILAGPWSPDNATLAAYGVETIPSIWLIGPNGNVLAKELTLEALENELTGIPLKK